MPRRRDSAFGVEHRGDWCQLIGDRRLPPHRNEVEGPLIELHDKDVVSRMTVARVLNTKNPSRSRCRPVREASSRGK